MLKLTSPVPKLPSRVRLERNVTTLGRQADRVDVTIDSDVYRAMISRVHARIVHDRASNAYSIHSQGLNGLLINRIVRDRAVLVDGDEITFGGAGVGSDVGKLIEKPASDIVYEFRSVYKDAEEEEKELKEKEAAASECDSQESKTDAKADARVFEDLNEEFICSICRDLICVAVALPCSHAFCKDCIETWFKRTRDCPSCRSKCSGKPVPVNALDNAIAHVAAKILSEEDQKLRKERIEGLLGKKTRASPSAKKDKLDIVVVSSSEDDDDSDDSDAIMHERSYGVQHASSGRSCCVRCGQTIRRNDLRWYRTAFHENGFLYQQYFHLDCYRPPRHGFDGIIYERLNREEMERVQRRLY